MLCVKKKPHVKQQVPMIKRDKLILWTETNKDSIIKC